MMKSTLALGLFSAICINSFSAKAQLKDCNAFIQGKYLEVGVNFNGAYGSSTTPPSGYHPNGYTYLIGNASSCVADTVGLGFVVDPAKDGWADSTAPARSYYGDYFLPGFPQEGWSIMTTTEANCWNAFSKSGLPSGMIGDNISHRVVGSRRATIWEGTYDSLLITQRTILDTANTYFTIRVKIKNLATRPRYDVYYMRTVDPDNEVTATYNYVTFNKIDLQLPNPANRTLVSAIGTKYNDAYLGMATKDLRAKSFIIRGGSHRYSSEPLLQPTDRIDSIYKMMSSNYLYAMNDTLRKDVGIGVVYKIDTLPAADSTIILLAYMFRPSDLDAAVNDEGLLPEDAVTGIAEQSKSTIKIAPNPFNNFVSLKGLSENDKVYLFDIYGKMLNLDWTVVSPSERNCNTSTLSTGMYILRVEDAEGRLKFKQMMQHD